MVTWGRLAELRPDLADAGRPLLYPPFANVGLAYLATVRPDGGPRVHPMCPILTTSDLFALIVPGPKCTDLLRDGRYAMHSFPLPDNEDAFYLVGTATAVDDGSTRPQVVDQFLGERPALGLTSDAVANQRLFAFTIETAMLTRTFGHGDPEPQHEIWHADGT